MTFRNSAVVFGLSLVLVLVEFSRADAQVCSPRVVSAHQPDTYSMRTFAEFSGWRELSGDAKAWAVFEYLTDVKTGLFPMGVPMREGPETLYEHAVVRDPVKMLNVYGMAFCDVFGPVMAGIWEDMGLGSARTVDLPGLGHVASEVHYDGKWHYLDLDLRAAFRRRDGRLASLADARAEKTLWQRERGPRFFPLDDLDHLRKVYAETAVRHRYGVHSSGHTMDYRLRPGETFRRWWKPQGDRWLHRDSYVKSDFHRKLVEREPRGPKSKHPSFTVHTYGNGRFRYEPDLTNRAQDFASGADQVENLRSGPQGVTLVKPGEGSAVFEIRSPYVIVPIVEDWDQAESGSASEDEKSDSKKALPKKRGASVVEIDATKGTKVEISLDNGITWEPIAAKKFPATLDLSEKVAGTYGYRLRLELKGKPDEAVIRSLRVTTWVQLAPASLPALRKGTNRMQVKTGDHYGLPTRVVAICPNGANLHDVSKHLVFPPERFTPKQATSRIRGTFVVRAAAPVGSRIAWFSAGASFRTHQQKAATKTRNAMAYSVGTLQDFTEIYRADVPTDVEHWHYNVAREVRLEEPAETVYIRYTGDPAVNNVRVYLHCLEEREPNETRLVVTHAWTEEGKERTFSTSQAGPGEYEVDVAGEPVNEWVELAVPTLPASGAAESTD